VVQRYHLPEIVVRVRSQFPNLKLYLREGYQPQLESWLLGRELDLAITMVEGKPPQGIRQEELIQLKLALMVPEESQIRCAADLWKEDRIEEPLIALPASEGICRHFQRELARREIEWFTSLEVSSLGLIEAYVANGFGIGLGLHIPKMSPNPELRLIPLEEFPPVNVGALWVGKRTRLMDAFIEACHRRAAWMLE
jgi:DNA-binding transcriptional LysR family regulator